MILCVILWLFTGFLAGSLMERGRGVNLKSNEMWILLVLAFFLCLTITLYTFWGK